MKFLASDLVRCIGEPFQNSLVHDVVNRFDVTYERDPDMSKYWICVRALGVDFLIDSHETVFDGVELVSAAHFEQQPPETGERCTEDAPIDWPKGLRSGMSCAEASECFEQPIKVRKVKGPLGVTWEHREQIDQLKWRLIFETKKGSLHGLLIASTLFDHIYYR